MNRLTFSDARFSIALSVAVLLAAAPCRAQQPDTTAGTGAVIGRVVDSLSHSIGGALVSIDSLPSAVATSDSGSFRLESVPVGEHLLWIRQLGFKPQAFHITVVRNSTRAVVARVTRDALALPTVKTEVLGQWGKPSRLDYTTKYDEFYRRRAEAVTGRFYTHDDLDSMRTPDLLDMLNRVPGVRVDTRIDTTSLSMPGCSTGRILIMLDDQAISPGPVGLLPASGNVQSLVAPTGASGGALSDVAYSLLKSLHLENVESIEVYHHFASLPVEAANGYFCGEIRIWTR